MTMVHYDTFDQEEERKFFSKMTRHKENSPGDIQLTAAP